MKGRITVQLKSGVLDVEGAAIGRALQTLGFAGTSVRVGRTFEVDVPAETVEAARALLDDMARKLLANPVMETFRVEVLGDVGDAPSAPTHGAV